MKVLRPQSLLLLAALALGGAGAAVAQTRTPSTDAAPGATVAPATANGPRDDDFRFNWGWLGLLGLAGLAGLIPKTRVPPVVTERSPSRP